MVYLWLCFKYNFLCIFWQSNRGYDLAPFTPPVRAVRHTAAQYSLVSYCLFLMKLFNFILFLSEPWRINTSFLVFHQVIVHPFQILQWILFLPSLHFHYRNFFATMDSADFSLFVVTTGSLVRPHGISPNTFIVYLQNLRFGFTVTFWVFAIYS